jgi:hypothetical protein
VIEASKASVMTAAGYQPLDFETVDHAEPRLDQGRERYKNTGKGLSPLPHAASQSASGAGPNVRLSKQQT